MTQEEFNQMLAVAIAQGFPGGTYVSKYSGEEMDALLDKVNEIYGVISQPRQEGIF